MNASAQTIESNRSLPFRLGRLVREDCEDCVLGSLSSELLEILLDSSLLRVCIDRGSAEGCDCDGCEVVILSGDGEDCICEESVGDMDRSVIVESSRSVGVEPDEGC